VGYREGRFIDLLPELQAVSARVCTPLTDEHPGQLAWSSIYEGREAPAVVFDGEAYGFLEAPDFLEVGGDVSRAAEVIDGPLASRLAELGGQIVPDAPWDIQLTIDLSTVTVPVIPGYRFRHVERSEAAARAACHRAAWSDRKPSRMTEQMYQWLMDTPYYDTGLDWVAVSESDGEMAASCVTWVCGDVALVEPGCCATAHRRRGLGGGVTLAALAAARDKGAKTGVVRPPGHDGYPVPLLVYRSIGFTDRLRNREFRFAAG
jgi:hypothetical protein